MKDKTRFIAIIQALFVTLLWSSSFILIKRGLASLPALTFAGLRYTLAGLLLILYVYFNRNRMLKNKINKSQWIKLFLLGLFLYFITQGAQFLGLYYLPAVHVSLFLNVTPLFVMIFATTFLNERPTKNNIIGVVIFFIGIIIYFVPINIIEEQMIGYIIMIIGTITNAIATVLGRDINKNKNINPAVVTAISMTIGGILLLISGVITEPFPTLDTESIINIIVLAVVNTAFAFTLWNHTMRVLSSIESSIINNTMLIQIAILSWLFMNESLNNKEIIAVLIVVVGAFLVQYKKTIAIKNN